MSREANSEEESELDHCWFIVVNEDAEGGKTEQELNISTNYEDERNSSLSSEIHRLSSVMKIPSACRADKNVDKSSKVIKCVKCDKVFLKISHLITHTKNCEKHQVNLKKQKCKGNTADLARSKKRLKQGIKLENCRKKQIMLLNNDVPSSIENGSNSVAGFTNNTLLPHQNDSSVILHSGSKMEDFAPKCGFKNIFQCVKCSYRTVYRYNFRQHIAESHSEQTSNKKPSFTTLYQCDECGLLFKDVNHLNDHLENHTSVSAAPDKNQGAQTGEYYDQLSVPLECPICSSDFFSVDKYNQHIQLYHNIDKRLRLELDPDRAASCNCKMCGLIFYPYLLNGVKPPDSKCVKCFSKGLKPSERQYCCENCGKLLPSLVKLNVHRRRVHNPTLFQCPKCPRVLKHKNGYKMHLLRHKGRVGCVCEVCGKVNHDPIDLKRHSFKHTITIPAKCEVGSSLSTGSLASTYERARRVVSGPC